MHVNFVRMGGGIHLVLQRLAEVHVDVLHGASVQVVDGQDFISFVEQAHWLRLTGPATHTDTHTHIKSIYALYICAVICFYGWIMLNDLNILYKYTFLFPKNGILENGVLIKGLDVFLLELHFLCLFCHLSQEHSCCLYLQSKDHWHSSAGCYNSKSSQQVPPPLLVLMKSMGRVQASVRVCCRRSGRCCSAPTELHWAQFKGNLVWLWFSVAPRCRKLSWSWDAPGYPRRTYIGFPSTSMSVRCFFRSARLTTISFSSVEMSSRLRGGKKNKSLNGTQRRETGLLINIGTGCIGKDVYRRHKDGLLLHVIHQPNLPLHKPSETGPTCLSEWLRSCGFLYLIMTNYSN